MACGQHRVKNVGIVGVFRHWLTGVEGIIAGIVLVDRARTSARIQVNSKNINIWGIIPAAGIGRRLGATTPKQYLKLMGKTILEHSLEKMLACDRLSGTVVGIAPDDVVWPALGIGHPRLLGAYPGGVERVNTVIHGLDFLSSRAAPADWVLVHDAVRPCVSPERIEALINRGLASDYGAILASRVVDTIKRVDANGRIGQTLDRRALMLATTPQLFPIRLLRQALDRAIEQQLEITDESSAIEALGRMPLAIEDRRDNIKITRAEDLDLARLILDQQGKIL